MTTLSDTPRALRGAIIGVDPFNPVASVIVFQYNPDSLTRTVRARGVQRSWWEPASQGEALRLAGPPEETVSLEIELDAADQVGGGGGRRGVTPTLAALEMLLYPKASLVIANQVLVPLGVLEVVPPEAPLTLLVFGATKVLPVRITELRITEQLFDAGLDPIQARVSLGVRVLTYDDLGFLSVGGGMFLAHQIAKEALATAASVGAAASLGATVGVGGI